MVFLVERSNVLGSDDINVSFKYQASEVARIIPLWRLVRRLKVPSVPQEDFFCELKEVRSL